MKTILCYGDSLTYGANPIPGQDPRHAYEDRWPGALEGEFAGKIRVIAEGLGGRTAVHDDFSADADRNGARILPTILQTHSPLDMIIVMLGTNDLKPHHGGSALEAANGVRRIVQIIKGHYGQQDDIRPAIIIVSPPTLCDSDHPEMMRHFGGKPTIEESRQMSRWYRLRAEEAAVSFFDASTVARADPSDGVHLDAANTRAIGKGLAPLVGELLGIGY